jgi:PAS domain S-box-containing protein
MSDAMSILLVADSEDDGKLIEDALRQGGFDAEVSRVTTETDFCAALDDGGCDAIVCNIDFARTNDRCCFDAYKKSGKDLPFIFISDVPDMAAAMELVAAGAHDFVEKDRLGRLAPALIRELRASRLRAESQDEFTRREKEAKDVLMDAIRQGPYGVGLYDVEDRLVSWNEQYRQHFLPGIELREGMDFEFILRQSIALGKIDLDESKVEGWIEWRRAKRKSPSGPFELNYDGRWVLVDEHRTSDGGTTLFIIDITANKEAEATLRDREAQLQAILDNSPASIVVKDLNFRFSMVNAAFVERHRKSAEEIIGETSQILFPDDVAKKIHESDKRVRNGETDTFLTELPGYDGSAGEVPTFLNHRFPIRNTKGEVIAIGVISTDISEQKRIEEALRIARDELELRIAERTKELRAEIGERERAEIAARENEATLRGIFDNSIAHIHLKTTDGKFVLANQAFLDWSGLPQDGYVGKTVFDIATNEWADKIAEYEKLTLESGEPVTYEQEATLKDGRTLFLQTTKFPIPNSDGDVTRIGTLATDITELKQAEEEHRERERLLRAVIDNSPSAISLMDTDQRLTLVNAEWARSHGVDPEFAIGKTLSEIGSEQEIEQSAAYDREVLKTGMPVEFEVETIRTDGLPQTHMCAKFPIPGTDGQPIGIGSTYTNITERKRAEEALRWSERDLRGILDNMVDTFFRTDRNGRIIMVSPSISQLLGTTTEEALGREFRSFFADPSGYDNLTDQLSRHRGELESHEMRLQRPDGVDVWVLATARYYFDDDGDIAGIEGVTHDITMRKRAEEALHRSEDRFRDFAEATSDWMWESDADMKFSYVSARLFETTGVDPKNVIGKSRQQLRTPDGDDNEWKTYENSIAEHKPFRDFEYSTINDSGERRTLRISGKPRFDEDGAFLGYRGTGTDITQERAAELREARTRQRFLDAIETVPVGFALFDSDDRLVLWNNLYEVMAAVELDLQSGSSFESLIRESVELGLIADANGREEEWIGKRLEKHRNPMGPFIVLRAGKWVQIREHKTPDGNILLVADDITDLRRAEESVRESERQLKTFINSIPDIAWLKDSENRLIAVNEAYARQAGRRINELIGKTDLEIWPKDLSKVYWDTDEEVKWARSPIRNEEIVEKSDGSRVWFDTIKAPLLDEFDHVVGTVGTGRDVTDRKKAEDELRKLSAAVEQSPAAILITNPDGMVEYANPKYFVTTGFEPDEVLGKLPVFFEPRDTDPDLIRRITQTVKSGQEWRSEGRYKRKDGEHYWSSLAVSPITNADGIVSHFLGIAEDTSDKRKMDEQLRHAQKLEAVGTLAGGVAHDFNNILTGILGHCYIAVEKTPTDSDICFNLDQITVASNRARDLVQQLLAFSRRRESDLKPISLQAIVDEAVKLVHASIPSTIAINWHVAEDAGFVMADPTQIHQVLLNLCSNAVDAIGGKSGQIDVKIENIVTDQTIAVSQSNLEPGSYARLSIADNGSGMDAYTLDRVFDPFFTTKPVGSGTGLGLAAVHGIIQDHDGGISVESEPGKGTIFNLFLPCIANEEIHKEERKDTGFGGTERILLVDDERMVLQSIGPYLEHFGYRVEALTSAAAALAVFESMPDEFHLVITDQVMPGMTGDMLASKLKEIRPNLPIILCTGYAPPATEAAIAAMGVNEIVGKPIEPSELGHIIRRTLDDANPDKVK